MRRLYEAADRIEAQMLVDLLRDNRISAVVLGDYLSGAAGELPATLFPAVWVLESQDWARAAALLDDFQHRFRNATAVSWRCPVCGAEMEGGFDVCWNCGTPRK